MTTIHDVAKRANVSPVTVSRVINGASNVNSATREKVERAIQDLGYVPNLSARSLRSRQTSTLALIVPDITNAFWTTIARGVEDTAQAEGYSVLLCNTDESLSKQNGYINAVLQQRVDGVIIAPYDSDAHNLSQLGKLKTPVVVLDRRVEGWDVDTVRTDSISGAYALTQHLISLGHRHIAIISGPQATSTAQERVVGYCLALEEAGIAVDERLIRRGEYRARSGRAMTDQLFDEGINPTAIVAANNLVATGILESLQSHGKTVPQDVALVCFDDLPELARFYPFMTVLVQPAYDMGINAAQLLLSRINADAPLHPRQVILPTRMVLRYSCGRLLNRPDAGLAYLTPLKDQSETILVRPLAGIDDARMARYLPNYSPARSDRGDRFVDLDQADAGRLTKVLLHRKADRLPHVEARITNKALLEYVLQRSLPYHPADLESGRQSIAPLDYVEFARRVGLDAIPCEISWRPGPVPLDSVQEAADRVTQAFPPPPLTEVFNRLEGYLRAAQGSRIGVYVTFSGFAGPAFQAAGVACPPEMDESRRIIVERLMDLLMSYQEKAIRAVCDRFSSDLAFAVIRDDLFGWPGLTVQSDLFQEAILPRLFRLIAPIREHSLLVGLNSTGPVEAALPILYKRGFDIIQSADPRCNDLPALRADWDGRFTFMGGFPLEHLTTGSRETVETKTGEFCQAMRKGSSFVLGVAGDITPDVQPELFLALARAAHRCVKS